MIKTDAGYLKYITRFLSVGLIATAIHALVYLVITTSFTINPQFANVSGYVCAFLFSYYYQMNWTFSERQKKSGGVSFFRFLATSLMGLSLNAFFVFVVTDLLILPAPYAIVGIVFITPPLTFVLLNLWVFPETKRT